MSENKTMKYDLREMRQANIYISIYNKYMEGMEKTLFKVDTGADRTVIELNKLKRLGYNENDLIDMNDEGISASNHKMKLYRIYLKRITIGHANFNNNNYVGTAGYFDRDKSEENKDKEGYPLYVYINKGNRGEVNSDKNLLGTDFLWHFDISLSLRKRRLRLTFDDGIQNTINLVKAGMEQRDLGKLSDIEFDSIASPSLDFSDLTYSEINVLRFKIAYEKIHNNEGKLDQDCLQEDLESLTRKGYLRYLNGDYRVREDLLL